MSTQKSNQLSSKAIVLVHGGFVDGSGWAGVYNILKEKGYNVAVVQNPTKSLAEDVAFTKSAIDSLKSEVVLVGHSYGGVVITEAGTHPRITDLVYIAAFAPDKGESVSSLIANPPPGAPVPPILPPQEGYLFLDRGKFAASSLRMSNWERHHSWPTLKFHGALTPYPVQSLNPRGKQAVLLPGNFRRQNDSASGSKENGRTRKGTGK
jgi:pimeloyl-ACP methyl ester carboxylesterase